MKKAIFVVRVDNYLPELCAITIPTIKSYADKIGADYFEITKRKFPDFPPTYEKMQVYKMGKGYDRVALIDADYMIRPDAPDMLSGMSDDYVGCLEAYDSRGQFKFKGTDFEKDGRYIGVATNFVVTTKKTHSVWKPFSRPWTEVRKDMKREWIVDEYCVSLNMAKHRYEWTGLHFCDECHDWFVHIGIGTNLVNNNFMTRLKKIKQQWINMKFK